MGQAKVISAIIPTYNREKYIKEAVDSVLNQELPPGYKLEVIVVDDGSTDGTPDILKTYGKKIVYKRIKNSGRPAVPRNVALKIAKGELVAFQDSDDLWVKDKLARQLSAFEDPEVVLAYGNAEIITENGDHTGKTVIDPSIGKSGFVFEEVLQTNFVSTLTVVAKKEAIIKAGCFSEAQSLRGVEDYDLWLKMARHGKFEFINSNIALHRVHDFNISNDIDATFNPHIVSAYRSLLRSSLNNGERRSVHRAMAHILQLNSSRSQGAGRIGFAALAIIHKVLARL